MSKLALIAEWFTSNLLTNKLNKSQFVSVIADAKKDDLEFNGYSVNELYPVYREYYY